MLQNVAANTAKYRSIFNQIDFAKKQNLEEEYTLLQGKLFLAEWLKYSWSVGLLCIEQYMDASNYLFNLQYHQKLYQGLEYLKERFLEEPTIIILNQKFREIMKWKEGMVEIIGRFWRSLRGSQLENNNEFWLIQAMSEYTLELTGYVKKTNNLLEIFEKLSSDIFASKNAIEIYDLHKQRQMKQLSENAKTKELKEILITVINLFKEDDLRNFRVKGNGEETILEESSIEIGLDVLEEE